MGTVISFTASKPSVREAQLDEIAASLRERFEFEQVIILGRRKIDWEADCSGGDDGRLIGPVIAVAGDTSRVFWSKFISSLECILGALGSAEGAHICGLKNPRLFFKKKIFAGAADLFGRYDTKVFLQHIRQHNALAKTVLAESKFVRKHNLLRDLGTDILFDDGETSFPS